MRHQLGAICQSISKPNNIEKDSQSWTTTDAVFLRGTSDPLSISRKMLWYFNTPKRINIIVYGWVKLEPCETCQKRRRISLPSSLPMFFRYSPKLSTRSSQFQLHSWKRLPLSQAKLFPWFLGGFCQRKSWRFANENHRVFAIILPWFYRQKPVCLQCRK